MATKPPTLLGKLGIILDALEHKLSEAFGAPDTDYVGLCVVTAREYQAVVDLRNLVDGRLATVAKAAQGPPPSPPLHYVGTEIVLEALIEYHDAHTHLCRRPSWGVDDHRRAAETLNLLRGQLDSRHGA